MKPGEGKTAIGKRIFFKKCFYSHFGLLLRAESCVIEHVANSQG